MRTEDIKRLYARRGVLIEPVSAPYPKDDAVDESISEEQHLLMSVFAADPLTNKPMNDLVLTENSRLDPVIREYIKKNLQAPQSPEDAPSDYAISEELCRRADETVYQYQQRLRQLTLDSADYIQSANRKIRSASARKKSGA